MPRKANRIPVDDTDFDYEGEITKLDEEQKIAFGWAYVCQDKDGKQVFDKSGEFISDPEELERAAYSFVLNSRRGRDFHGMVGKDDITDEAGEPVATLVESIVFTKEKQEALGVPPGTLPTGWFVGFKVHQEDLWQSFRKGERRMFSVHGKGKARRVLSGSP
jgi:hypothetical protein